MRSRTTHRGRRAFTLVEILIVVALMGIAGALVVPAMGQVGVLRIRAAVRSMVSDITYAQSDAMASQNRRVIVFGLVGQRDPGTGVWTFGAGNGYTIYSPTPGSAALDLNNDWLPDPENGVHPYTRDFSADEFGGAQIVNVDINTGDWLIFDELGGPVQFLTGTTPGAGGRLDISSVDSTFRIVIEPYTGRVTVTKL
ncbi:MAG: pilus assembly FimT family protein [Planctomycetota bacterium]|jgi:prepilin-type N-terminal cleavage/methylation domain-containing protein